MHVSVVSYLRRRKYVGITIAHYSSTVVDNLISIQFVFRQRTMNI